jgi:hypothetical protein
MVRCDFGTVASSALELGSDRPPNPVDPLSRAGSFMGMFVDQVGQPRAKEGSSRQVGVWLKGMGRGQKF